jgi:hypothetical protein
MKRQLGTMGSALFVLLLTGCPPVHDMGPHTRAELAEHEHVRREAMGAWEFADRNPLVALLGVSVVAICCASFGCMWVAGTIEKGRAK